jgi:hypothetical protein
MKIFDYMLKLNQNGCQFIRFEYTPDGNIEQHICNKLVKYLIISTKLPEGWQCCIEHATNLRRTRPDLTIEPLDPKLMVLK